MKQCTIPFATDPPTEMLGLPGSCLRLLCTTLENSAIDLWYANVTLAGGSVWLKDWSSVNERVGRNPDVAKYLGIYFAFGVGSAALVVVQTLILWIFCSIEVRPFPCHQTQMVSLSPKCMYPSIIVAFRYAGETDRKTANTRGRGNTGLPQIA